jgi:hypothetical protein
MSGKKTVVQSKRSSASKTIFFTLGLLMLLNAFGLDLQAQAAKDKSKKASTDAQSRKKNSDLKLTEFQAEKFSEAVKINWKTSFESNVIGFRVWRDAGGQKAIVNEQLVAGSSLKRQDGLLETGDNYSIIDLEGEFNAVYLLEAIYQNGESVWYGEFGVQAGYETEEIKSEIANFKETISRGGQIERVDFAAENSYDLEKRDYLPIYQENYTSDSQAVKFEVSKNGWHRIEASLLAQYGFSGSSTYWRLLTDGVEQPFMVKSDGAIEFYGRGLDTFYTGARTYWLTKGSVAGKRIGVTSNSFNKKATDSWTRMIVEKKDKRFRAAGVVNGARDNWYAGAITATGSNITLNLSEITAVSGQNAIVGVDIQGGSMTAHQVTVSLNGSEVGKIDFSYNDRREWSVSVPVSMLVEGTNTVTLRSSASSDMNFLEAVRISYPRRLKASAGSLEFQVNSKSAVKVKGFSSPYIRLFDITNPASVKEYSSTGQRESDGTYTITVPAASGTRLMMAQESGVPAQSINALEYNNPEDLKNTSNRANFLIISPRTFFGTLSQLKAARDAEGLQTELVDIVDIYDEFNYGNKSADAIKSFLQYANANWSVKPSYVMVVGDASFDPRNYSGVAGKAYDLVPTMMVDTYNMEAVSDEMLVDFNGDNIGEMAIGRLPVRTQADVDVMVRKILAARPLSMAELNRRGASFVSDSPVGYDFSNASRRIVSTIPSLSANFIDRGSMDLTTTRNNVMNSVNSGAALVNYFGHGNVNNWSGSLLQNPDAMNMLNINAPSLMVMVACLNGSFAEIETDGLSESVMKAPNGGAFASWSASASNGAETQESLAKEFYKRVFSGMRLGDAARDSKTMFYMKDIRRTYVFFGDPTQKFASGQ